MKVRFGVGLGADVVPEELPGIVDQLEASGIDSLWFSELLYSAAVDPFVGMTFALARTTRLKVGTSVAVLRAATRSWSPSNSPRWRRWRRSGCCRSSGCGRRCPPNATRSWYPTDDAQRCSTNR